MRRRGRPPTRRAPEAVVPPPEAVVPPPEEHVDESAYVPPPAVQLGPPPPPEVVGGQIPLEQMAQMLATTFNQPCEPTVSIERIRKLEARNYDGIGDPEKACSWLEGNEMIN